MRTSPLLFLSALLGCLAAPAHSQVASSTPDMARRMQACSGCHGKEGRAAPDGYYPRIAGKPQAYLYAQLQHFKAERRSYAPMNHLVKNLSDAYLQDIAAYFAALDLPYPPPQPAPSDATRLRRGETLARQGDATLGLPACTTCHGDALTGVLPATPALLGLSRDYVNAQIGAWTTGLRRADAPDCMARVAQRLVPADIAAVSAWLARQPVPSPAHPASSPPSGGPGTAECAGLSGTKAVR
jgi:cytochrome c553